MDNKKTVKTVLHVTENWIKINIKKIELYVRNVTKKTKRRKMTKIQNKHHTSSGTEIFSSHQQPKVNNKNNRTLVMRFSNCDKTYLMIYFQRQK